MQYRQKLPMYLDLNVYLEHQDKIRFSGSHDSMVGCLVIHLGVM
jgi:hypothetical protein